MLSVHRYRMKLKDEGSLSPEEIEVEVKKYAEGRAASHGRNDKSGVKKPCSTKHCRLGDVECVLYRGCRDLCRHSGKRLTEMPKCPKDGL